VIEADQDAFGGVFTADDIVSVSLRQHADLREGEVLGDDATPAVGFPGAISPFRPPKLQIRNQVAITVRLRVFFV